MRQKAANLLYNCHFCKEFLTNPFESAIMRIDNDLWRIYNMTKTELIQAVQEKAELYKERCRAGSEHCIWSTFWSTRCRRKSDDF